MHNKTKIMLSDKTELPQQCSAIWRRLQAYTKKVLTSFYKTESLPGVSSTTTQDAKSKYDKVTQKISGNVHFVNFKHK